MQFRYDGDAPLYLQVAEQIEDGILSGAFPEGSQVPSTTEISVGYKINPATVLKGITMLVEGDILYKKRGIGMFVSKGAQKQIQQKRQKEFYGSYVVKLLEEAQKLGIDKKRLAEMILEENN